MGPGVSVRPPRDVWTAAEDARLRAMCEGGASGPEMAADLGRPVRGVRQRLRRLKLKISKEAHARAQRDAALRYIQANPPAPRPPRVRSPRPRPLVKAPPARVHDPLLQARVRALVEGGASIRCIARDMALGQVAVRHILELLGLRGAASQNGRRMVAQALAEGRKRAHARRKAQGLHPRAVVADQSQARGSAAGKVPVALMEVPNDCRMAAVLARYHDRPCFRADIASWPRPAAASHYLVGGKLITREAMLAEAHRILQQEGKL